MARWSVQPFWVACTAIAKHSTGRLLASLSEIAAMIPGGSAIRLRSGCHRAGETSHALLRPAERATGATDQAGRRPPPRAACGAYYYPVLPHDSSHGRIRSAFGTGAPVGAEPEGCAWAYLEFTRRELLGKEPRFPGTGPYVRRRRGAARASAGNRGYVKERHQLLVSAPVAVTTQPRMG